jgi:hypothetical protein
MKKVILTVITFFAFSGCTAAHNPYAHVGASKTVNVGGIDVGVGIHDIIKLGK